MSNTRMNGTGITPPRESSGSCSSRSVMNSVAAGYIAGITGTLIGHPMDSAKVWLQTGKQRRLQSSHDNNGSASHQTERSPSAPTTATNTANLPPSRGATTSTSGVSTTPKQGVAAATSIVSSSTAASPSTAAPAAVASRQNSTLAILMQQNNSKHARGATSASSMNTMFRTTSSNLRALYSGVSGPLITVGFVQSINFAIYDSVRRILYHRHENSNNNNNTNSSYDTGASNGSSSKTYLDSDPLSHVAAASMTAGAALALITNPLLLIKTKQQTATTSQHLSYRQAVLQTIKWSSHHRFCIATAVRNLYTGFAPHAVSEIVGRGVYFCTYEGLKRQFAAQRQERLEPRPPDHLQYEDRYHQQQCTTTTTATNTATNTLTDRMLAAGLSGIVCWSIIFPLDAVRCRMYASAATNGAASASSLDMAVHMYKTFGWQSFYRGFGVTLLRAGPVAALVLPIYDVALERLSRLD